MTFALLTLVASAQVVEPESYTYYQIVNGGGFALGHFDESTTPKQCAPNAEDARQIFEFIPSDDGTYMIRSASDYSYVCMITSWWDTWDMSFDASIPSDISKAKYSIESIVSSEYVALKNMGRKAYCGWDKAGEGQGIYCNKPLNEKAYWKIVELPLENQVDIAVKTMLKYADEDLSAYAGLGNVLYDLAMIYEGFVPNDRQEAKDAIRDIQNGMIEVKAAMDDMALLEKSLLKAEKLLSMQICYPGFEKFQSVYEDIKNSIDHDVWGLSEYGEALTRLDEAILEYYYSQIPSEDSPADYTFLIQTPHFCLEEAEPTIVDGVFVYPNGADYVDGKQPSDASTVGWYKGANGSGDQRVNYVQQRVCWNAWCTNFDEISINQDLKNLPSGYYTLSADMSTQNGCVTDQRLYANSNLSLVVSPSLNPNDFQEPLEQTWKTLTTDRFMVIDGKVTIGAVGSGDKEKTPADCGGTSTDYRRGWFLVTNFKLNYYGPLSEEDIRTAFDKKLAELQAMCDTLVFKGDKKAFQDSINKYKSVSDIEDINQAMDALSIAQSKASLSASKQYDVLTRGIMSALKDSIDKNIYEGVYSDMADNLCGCMLSEVNSDNATYLNMDSLEHILYVFRDEYVPVLAKAEVFETADKSAEEMLNDNIDRQVDYLSGVESLPEESLLDKYIYELEKAISACVVSDIISGGGDDYTSMIRNPMIDNSSNLLVPEGWNVYMKNSGRAGAVGATQNVEGRNGWYLDAWASGKLLYHAYQTIENLPNGKYEMRAMTRSDAINGVYVFAIADNDSNTTVLSPVIKEQMNITELGGPTASGGKDSIAFVSDSYGSIFAEAYKATNGGVSGSDSLLLIVSTNGGKGWGWHYTSVEIEIKNHILTIGFTCDSTFTQKFGGKAFDGWWLSADNFSLRLVEAGDNGDWNPVTGVSVPDIDLSDGFNVKVVNRMIMAPIGSRVYTISGYEVNPKTVLDPGIYIVSYGEEVVKVVVK